MRLNMLGKKRYAAISQGPVMESIPKRQGSVQNQSHNYVSLKTKLGFSQLQQANNLSTINQQLAKSQKSLSNLELTAEEPKASAHEQEDSISLSSSIVASPKAKKAEAQKVLNFKLSGPAKTISFN